MNILIKFKLSDLCRTCIQQMVLLAASEDRSSATAIRNSIADTVNDLKIIERDVQSAIRLLTTPRKEFEVGSIRKLNSQVMEQFKKDGAANE